jgi:hypothetical protein
MSACQTRDGDDGTVAIWHAATVNQDATNATDLTIKFLM